MSNYYVNTQNNQPGGMNFSSWNGNSEEIAESAQMIPEPPMRYATPPQQLTQPADPNATRLVREHFRTARDNALYNTVPLNQKDKDQGMCDTKNWWGVVLICVVLIFIVGGCMYAGKSPNVSDTPNMAFGSGAGGGGVGVGNISSGLLNDLEFL